MDNILDNIVTTKTVKLSALMAGAPKTARQIDIGTDFSITWGDTAEKLVTPERFATAVLERLLNCPADEFSILKSRLVTLKANDVLIDLEGEIVEVPQQSFV